MTRILASLLAALTLTGCNFSESASHVTAALGVDEPAVFALTENAVSSSVEPVASSSVEPVCENYTWRGVVYDCHGNYLHDL